MHAPDRYCAGMTEMHCQMLRRCRSMLLPMPALHCCCYCPLACFNSTMSYCIIGLCIPVWTSCSGCLLAGCHITGYCLLAPLPSQPVACTLLCTRYLLAFPFAFTMDCMHAVVHYDCYSGFGTDCRLYCLDCSHCSTLLIVHKPSDDACHMECAKSTS